MNSFKNTSWFGCGVMLFGLAMLAACSGSNDDGFASTYSETNTGTPIAQLDTSLVDKYVTDGKNGCVIEVDSTESVTALAKKTLAKKVAPAEDDTVVLARPMCGSFNDIFLYINAKGRVVDSKGMPLSGAKVYKDNCNYDDLSCQFITDADGNFYMDSVNFLTYWENFAYSTKSYAKLYESVQLRVISADTSLGANASAYFGEATFVYGEDGKPVAILKDVVVEPVYSAKLDLNSINAFDREMNEGFEEDDGICIEDHWDPLSDEYYSRYDWYPCQPVNEEDKKNGYVIIYGLPEGTYDFCIGNAYGKTCSSGDTLVVKR